MIGRSRIGLSLALALATLAAACAGPRLEASWYLVYEPVQATPYPLPDPYATDAPAAPKMATAPAAAPAPVGTVYVLLRNLGDKVELVRVLLAADGQPLAGADRSAGPYVLNRGEILVLPLQAREGFPRTCLIPTELQVEASSPRRTKRLVKVKGGLPQSLPDDWIQRCNGSERRTAAPPPGGTAGGD